MKLITEKTFYKNILAIALPIALQNLITFANSMMDTLMLGRADTTGTFLSASALANQPFFILSLVCFGLSGAATVLSSQYWGKGDIKAIRVIFSIILKIALVISLLMALTILIFPEWVMGLYSDNPAIISAGADYLRIIGYAYVLFGVGNTLLCCIRSVELVKISVIVNSASFLINVVLNWVLIFGNLGAPALGIRGAAIASLSARTVEFLITFGYIFFLDKRLALRPKHLLLFNKVFLADLVRHGSPVLANEVMWSLGITLQAALLGHISYGQGDPVAANSIASMVQQLSTIIIFGIANASAVMVGKSIGENNPAFAKREAYTLKYISVLIGVFACGFILLLRDPVISFYTIPEESKLLARQLMNVIAIITIFVSISSISIVGILRGGGDTRFCLISEMISLWLVALPLAFLGKWLMLPVPVVLLLMKIDEPLKSLFCFIRLHKDKWIRTLTRSF